MQFLLCRSRGSARTGVHCYRRLCRTSLQGNPALKFAFQVLSSESRAECSNSEVGSEVDTYINAKKILFLASIGPELLQIAIASDPPSEQLQGDYTILNRQSQNVSTCSDCRLGRVQKILLRIHYTTLMLASALPTLSLSTQLILRITTRLKFNAPHVERYMPTGLVLVAM